ncbi:Hypothetical predicted protein [Mytilus galloprovincialis]|uniref:RNase H type-1 domain-containing protein n=1 Tax=Mytilus galloprovincialis TaxID=29158 RepID=A0A8B6GKC9_MYTGA|nr:Hypothetical predicted protein [Mytilus galloprovincialis]
MQIVLGDIVRRNTRFLYDCVQARASWNAPVRITVEAIDELGFWKNSCRTLNLVGVDICSVNLTDMYDIELFCDASDVGFGGYFSTVLDFHSENHEIYGNWFAGEQFESSTWRELETVRRVLNSYDSFLENKTVKVNSDNKNVTHILNVGSKKYKLQKVVTDILNSCSKKNIGLQTNWVPRTENKHADFLSRHTDPDDWSIEKNVFHDLSCTFGPFTVDRFSTHYNAQSSRFNSRIWCPGTEAINAFSQFWGGDTNWLVPPPSLVAMTINKIIKDKAKCMLVIPEWKSAPYWPLLYKDGGFRDFIKEVIYLPRYNIIVKGTGLKLRQNVENVVESSGVGENNVLRSLAGKMALYIVDSKSENTSKKYFAGFNRWKLFINEHGFSDLPAEPVHVALYLTFLIDKHSSPSVLQSAIYSIKWAHELNGYIDPTSNSFIKFLLESCKRRNGKPVVKKDPVDNIMLRELCSIYQDSSDLLVIRDLTMILIAYAGFLRFDELSSLTCRDIKIYEEYMSIFLSHSKTDQYRQGNEILISKGSSQACPLLMYKRYLGLSSLDVDSDHFVFRPIFRSGGGASAAAKSDVNERCIKRHGRWKSDLSKDGYIADSFDNRISVSKNLGL